MDLSRNSIIRKDQPHRLWIRKQSLLALFMLLSVKRCETGMRLNSAGIDLITLLSKLCHTGHVLIDGRPQTLEGCFSEKLLTLMNGIELEKPLDSAWPAISLKRCHP